MIFEKLKNKFQIGSSTLLIPDKDFKNVGKWRRNLLQCLFIKYKHVI